MTKALIIGGGVAGPVTAMALQRAGIEAAVYEAYPRARRRSAPT
jgi:FAD-dependent urate hydroxylase